MVGTLGGDLSMEAFENLLKRMSDIQEALKNCQDMDVRRELWSEFNRIYVVFVDSLIKS